MAAKRQPTGRSHELPAPAARDQRGTRVPKSGDGEGPVPNACGLSKGATSANGLERCGRPRLQHGERTAAAIAGKRRDAAIMNELRREVRERSKSCGQRRA